MEVRQDEATPFRQVEFLSRQGPASYRESSLAWWEVTSITKRRQSDRQATTKVKRLSPVTCVMQMPTASPCGKARTHADASRKGDTAGRLLHWTGRLRRRPVGGANGVVADVLRPPREVPRRSRSTSKWPIVASVRCVSIASPDRLRYTSRSLVSAVTDRSTGTSMSRTGRTA